MDARTRRQAIYEYLQDEEEASSIKDLAEKFSVDEKEIQGDLILLRATQKNIIKDGDTYTVREKRRPYEGVLGCVHSDVRLAEEFTLIIQAGGYILTEETVHPQYGHLISPLNLTNMQEVEHFIEHLEGPSLGILMGGHHYHRLACKDEAHLDKIIDHLRQAGFKLRKEDPENYGS